jgi:hypothetical protein
LSVLEQEFCSILVCVVAVVGVLVIREKSADDDADSDTNDKPNDSGHQTTPNYSDGQIIVLYH